MTALETEQILTPKKAIGIETTMEGMEIMAGVTGEMETMERIITEERIMGEMEIMAGNIVGITTEMNIGGKIIEMNMVRKITGMNMVGKTTEMTTEEMDITGMKVVMNMVEIDITEEMKPGMNTTEIVAVLARVHILLIVFNFLNQYQDMVSNMIFFSW